MGKQRDILDALQIRMKDLGFEESNHPFNIDYIPASIRNHSYTAEFEAGNPDFDIKFINKIATVERNLTLRLLYKLPASHSGRGSKETLRCALDEEEKIVIDLLKAPIDPAVHFITFDSVTTDLTESDGGEWLLSTLSFRVKFQLSLL